MSADLKPTLHDRFVANLTRESTDPWTSFETGIRMRDGIELAADVYLPKGQTGPFPTIMECTPYDKSGAFTIDDVSLYSQNGYAVVVADLRGLDALLLERGRSERDEAIAFGRVYRQNTIVFAENGRPEIIVTDPTADDVGRTFHGNWRVRS